VEELFEIELKVEALDESHEFAHRLDPPKSQLEHCLDVAAKAYEPNAGSHRFRAIRGLPEVQANARELVRASTLSLEDLL
jgi:hypothetical protein